MEPGKGEVYVSLFADNDIILHGHWSWWPHRKSLQLINTFSIEARHKMSMQTSNSFPIYQSNHVEKEIWQAIPFIISKNMPSIGSKRPLKTLKKEIGERKDHLCSWSFRMNIVKIAISKNDLQSQWNSHQKKNPKNILLRNRNNPKIDMECWLWKAISKTAVLQVSHDTWLQVTLLRRRNKSNTGQYACLSLGQNRGPWKKPHSYSHKDAKTGEETSFTWKNWMATCGRWRQIPISHLHKTN